MGRDGRARLLGALADELEANADALVITADRETALGEPRLRFELARTTYQLRFMGAVAVEGSYLDASVESPGATPAGPRPDLRRTSVPLGPVAVFGASNFPFAFSAPGGDTASALAAGCPVIVKAHGSHAATSQLVRDVFSRVVRDHDGPPGVFQLVFGREAGTSLVNDPLIAAVGFTGSVSGGRALFDAASLRPIPIPFYGELGSVNPVVITERACVERASAIGEGLAASMTLGNGQFCTKPGLYLVPRTDAGDTLISSLVAAVSAVEPTFMLNDGIRGSFIAGTAELSASSAVRVLHAAAPSGRTVGPLLVEAESNEVHRDHRHLLTEEYFGPFGVVIRYSSNAELIDVLHSFPPALTGTIHSVGGSDPDLPSTTAALAARSGRLVFDEYPTGVSVAWGMHHGGQYPASTSNATSVGSNAIKRWIRPLTFQNAPGEILPRELQDVPITGFPRRVDGVLVVGS